MHVRRCRSIVLTLVAVLAACAQAAGMSRPQIQTVEQLRCLCAIDIRYGPMPGEVIHGDYVQCIAHFSSRMVGTGVLTRPEAADEVQRAAHLSDAEILELEADCPEILKDPPCDPCPPPPCCPEPPPEERNWGVSVDIDVPFYEIDGTLHAVSKLWNYSGQDVFQGTLVRSCDVVWSIHDSTGAEVRTHPSVCFQALGTFDVPDQTEREAEVTLDLRDDAGEPLDPGYYHLRATWQSHGPEALPMSGVDICNAGLSPYADITFKIDTADQGCGGCPGYADERDNFFAGIFLCSNGVDDDCDGLVDCCDPGCRASFSCQIEGACEDGLDNDCDGDADCCDDDCPSGFPPCALEPERDCANGVDDNCNGLVDCCDPDCDTMPFGLPCLAESDCEDGIDNDCDGDVDCCDPDCAAEAVCDEQCFNAVDDDCDGLTDCCDSDCAADPGCVEDCDNGFDDDCDGILDCCDPDCASGTECTKELDCDDGIDDDCDGLVDCCDLDCEEACTEDCGNCADDDCDGLIDCCDPECVESPSCKEDCTNLFDDDCDTKVDCDDSDCASVCP